MKLKFDSQDRDFARSLSAAVRVGNDLWLGGDEGTKAMCFRPDGNDSADPLLSKTAECELVRAFNLPGQSADDKGKLPEVDLEGMDWDADGGYLWMVGSHSLKRKAAKPGKVAADSLEQDLKNLGRLGEISADGNRFLLGRLPLRVEDGVSTVIARGDQSPAHFAARLDCTRYDSDLLNALLRDPLLRPFLSTDIPGKDNGVDIEGLAWDRVRKRLLVGLRGPVLRGMAIILELETKDQFNGNETVGRLELLPIGPDGRLYRRHFLDLDGLAVRDLCFDGDDLLILAGPTMPIDWPVSIYRWKSARESMAAGERFIWRETGDLYLVVERQLEHSVRKQDNPEALMLANRERALVICDAPSEPRFKDDILRIDEVSLET